MGSILKFFDFTRASSSRKLFGGGRHGDGLEAPRNSLEFPMEISQGAHVDLEDIPVKLQSDKKNHLPTESLVEKFIDEEMLSSKNTRSSGFGDVNLSMGTKRVRGDKNPTFLSFASDYKKAWDFMLRYDSSSMPSSSSSNHPSLKQDLVLDSTRNLRMTKPPPRQHPQEEQLQKFKKEFEAWQTSKSWKHSKGPQLDDDHEHFEGNNQVIPQENLSKGEQNRVMKLKRISGNRKAMELRNILLTNKMKSNTPQGYRFQHEAHDGKQFQCNLKEEMRLSRPSKAAHEKWDISSPTAKIVVLKPSSRPWFTAPEIPEDEHGIQNVLREVKERFRIGIQARGKSRNSTIARENFIKTFFSRINSMHTEQNLEEEISENDSKKSTTRVAQSEPTRTDSFEYIDGDKRGLLAERVKDVLKTEGDVHCLMSHKGSSGRFVMEKEGQRWGASSNQGRSMFLSGLALALLFANTATPVVVRIAAELKLAHSEVGRLPISAALVNDMSCLLILSLAAIVAGDQKSGQKPHQKAAGTAVMLLMLAAAVGVMRFVIGRLNRRYLRRRHLGNWHGVAILVFVLAISCLTEMMGYSNMMACFILGLFFPRDGGAARTMVDWLTAPVNNIILPIYFAYAGFQTNLTELKDTKVLTAVAAVVGLSTVAKVAGTVMVTGLMDIPTHEGLVLGFLLNVKGHVHLIVLNVAKKMEVWNYKAFSALLVTLVVNTLIAGPVAAAIVGIRRRALKYRAMGLQHHQLKSELRMLTCVHSPRDMPTMLTLIEMSSGIAVGAPITAFMLHLVELTQRVTTTMLYHQKDDDDEDDGDDAWNDGGDDGDNDARRVHLATDAFRRQSGLKVRLVTAISGFASMHEDVCNAAEDVKAAVVVMPFHKHQRIDGKMQGGKEALREVNERVLRYAPCTVGILVDRGMEGLVAGQTPASAAAAAEQELRRVVVLFFGGADDREALSLGGRMAMHPCVSLTVVRFLPSESRRGGDSGVGTEMREMGDDHIRVAMPQRDYRRDEDEVFLAKFQDRFVSTGMVTYVEEFVSDGAETVAVLSSMVGSFSLFVVGKVGEGSSPLTVGMNDWEECPELGVIGDLLASSDFMMHGSVLVLQQHRTKQDDISSEFM